MKKLFLLLFVLHFVSYGQKADGLEICFEVQKSLKGFAADKEADDALDEILAVIGAAKNFYLIPCDKINNALALTYKGERFILYDKDFIDRINKATNNWSGKFILAHEVGHHINGHTRDFLIASVLDDQTKEKQREEELEADEFAGFIVAKLGAKYNQIKELINTIAPEKDDKYSTHPNRSKRLEAIKKGFDKVKFEPIVSKSNISLSSEKLDKKGRRSNWEYYESYPHSKRKKTSSNDPFYWKENEGKWPLVKRWSQSTGKTIATTPTKELEISVTQMKLKYNDVGSQPQIRSEIRQECMPYKNIIVTISGLIDTPKFLIPNRYIDGSYIKSTNYYTGEEIIRHTEAEKLKLKSMSKDYPVYQGMYGRIQYIIDDIAYGSFVISFNHWELDKDNIPGPAYSGETDFIWYTLDECNSLLNFVDALKKGQKLYLKLTNDVRTWNSDWYFDGSFNTPTYEFDLSGSSKALQLD